MMVRSLEGRLVLLQQAFTVLVVTVFALSALALTQATLHREETRRLEAAAQRLASDLDTELEEEGVVANAADSLIADEARSGFGIAVLDSSGGRVAASPELLPGGGPSGPRHAARARGRSGFWIEVSVPDAVREATLRALARTLAWATIPFLLAPFVLSRWGVRRALRPLAEMTQRADAITPDSGALTLGGSGGLAELERLRAAFDRLLARLDQQLRAERQFASDASHELRTPLTVLSGELELALRTMPEDPHLRQSLARANAQVRGMRDLVEALLLLRRAGEGGGDARRVFEPVDLSDVLEHARREALARYPDRAADLAVTAELDAVLSGHPVLLAAGVRNLLDNALKFTVAGVSVRATALREADRVLVRVDDAGAGIPESDRERVFDAFFRGGEARAEHSGFGLGLPILRRVVRAHGGDVALERSPLGGARFTLWFPRWAPSPDRSDTVRDH